MKFFGALYFATFILMVNAALAVDAPKEGIFQIDPMHSKVGFEVQHLVISTIEGKFNSFQGSIDIKNLFIKSTFNTTIETGSIDTGVDKRDEHLKSPDFFQSKEFPQITFKSTKVIGKPHKFKLVGDLTIKGVTRAVTLESKYLGSVVDGYGNEKIVLEGKTQIKRKEFGLTWNTMVEAGPVVGDDITIILKIQATKVKDATKSEVKK